MICIVAVDSSWAIGYQGKLLARNREDMKFFREQTTGNVVIMGRKTLESFPGGKPLKDRLNIVLTHGSGLEGEGLLTVSDMETALRKTAELESQGRKVYVIGGSSVYKQMLPYCDTALVTYMENKYRADAFFPNLDMDENWELTKESGKKEYPDGHFTFRTYRNLKKEM